MSLFVSYTRSDEALVRLIREDLERLGRSVWMDHQIHGGESWWREIIEEIQRAEIFVFALSNHSWRSKPCRLELRYAERLGIPVLPLQVGPLDSLFISLAEKQIIDYRGRTADAVVRLVAALTELSARRAPLPDPLPAPPDVPFEYLYRIAALMGPDLITPEAQDSLIAQLRSKLKEEDDEVARADIVKLLNELLGRGELTVRNAREIEEILAGVVARSVPTPDGGATRLPPTEQLHPVAAPEPADPEEPAERLESVAVEAKSDLESSVDSSGTGGMAEEAAGEGKEPEPRQVGTGTVPGWLADIVSRGAGAEPKPAPGPAEPAKPTGWWAQQDQPGRAAGGQRGAEDRPDPAAGQYRIVHPRSTAEPGATAPRGHTPPSGTPAGQTPQQGPTGRRTPPSGTPAGQAPPGSFTGHQPGTQPRHASQPGSPGTHGMPTSATGGHTPPSGTSGTHAMPSSATGGHPPPSGSVGGHGFPPGSSGGQGTGGHAPPSGTAGRHATPSGTHAMPSSTATGHTPPSGVPGGQGMSTSATGGHALPVAGAHTPPSGTAAGPTVPANRPVPEQAGAAKSARRLAIAGGLLGAVGIPFLFVAFAADHDSDSAAPATLLLFVTAFALSLAVVARARRAPGARAAILVALVGLAGTFAYCLNAWGAF